MTAITPHTTQSPETALLIQTALDLQARAFDALERVRAAAWNAGVTGNTSHAAEDRECDIAHEVTAAIAGLVKLATTGSAT